MANKSLNSSDRVFAAMLLELNTQTAQQARLQQELQSIKFELEQAAKTLAQKDQLIGGLQQDLEHAIDQLSKIKHRHPVTAVA